MNVKPKFLKVMKRLIITFLSVLALVLVANTMFGANTKTTPANGSTWTYTVAGMSANDNDDVNFKVNQDNSSFTVAAVATSEAEIISSDATIGATTTGEANVQVTWKVTSGTYYLWVQVTDDAGTSPTGCSNYRYITIYPEANNFVVTVYGMGVDDNATYTNKTAGVDDLTDCAAFVNADFQETTEDDGNSYVFFSVNRTGGNTSSTWSFTMTITNSVGSDITEFDYNDGTGWTASHSEASSITVLAAQNQVVIRILKANTAAGQTVTGDIGSTAVETLGNLADSGGDNSKTITISSYPDLYTGTFN